MSVLSRFFIKKLFNFFLQRFYTYASGQRGPPAPPHWAWDRRHGGQGLTLTGRRRPTAEYLLDAVPPTPGCYDDRRRAATLPAAAAGNDWPSLPPAGFVSIQFTRSFVTAQ